MQNHEFDFHECKGLRNLHEMKSEFLLRIIKKEITEEQAWQTLRKVLAQHQQQILLL